MDTEAFASYKDALKWLHGLLRFGQKPGLERVQWLLAELGNPERRLSFIHVAGTNGKGSTCAYLTSMLRAAGYSVGSFTSPYLSDFRERIRVGDEMIPQEAFRDLANQLKPLLDRCEAETDYGTPTEFEVITVIAICYFAQIVRPAVVVWETGLGGRLDSTNVVWPLVSVITNIGLDHTDVLGSTLGEIAYEKAGIIKPGVPVVTGAICPEANEVIERSAREKHCTLYQLGRDFSAVQESEQLGSQWLAYSSMLRREQSRYELQMNGQHQAENAGVALMVIDLLRNYYAYLLEDEEVANGLQQTRWPGRLEIVSKRPLVLLDGAHNTEGMSVLIQSVAGLIPAGRRIHILVAALADKPLVQIAAVMASLGESLEHIYLTTFSFARAASVEQMEDAWMTGGVEPAKLSLVTDWQNMLQTWFKQAQAQDDCLLICGSLYFIAQVRDFLPTIVEEAGE